MAYLPFYRLLAFLGLAFATALAGDLKIHVINVGWGSSVLVEGPGGKRILMEAGHGNRAAKVVDYLRTQAQVPAGGISYVVLGHNHADHGAGLPDVWKAGLVGASPRCFYNGSTQGASLVSTWFADLGQPTAAIPSATQPLIDLGDGTKVYCLAARGMTLAQGSAVSQKSNENDNSMGLLVTYGGFSYLWTSDMGGFTLDGCSGRTSSQVDMETPMILSAITAGVVRTAGVDVLHVGHHGSESSTHPEYVRAARPSVALISTGRGQSLNWDLPRTAVVDRVLRGECGYSPAPLVLQTEDGDRNDQGKRSTSGHAVGNILVQSDGAAFWVKASGDPTSILIADGSTVEAERAGAGLVNTPDPRGRAFAVHGDTPLPTPSFTLALSPSSVAFTQGGSATVQVSLAAKDGFTGTASLGLSSQVQGVTATFSGTSIPVPGTATLTLKAAATAPTGTTSVDVTGVSGSLTVKAPLSVQVNAAPVSTTFNEVEPNDTRSAANAVPDAATSLVGYFPSTSDNDDWYKLTLPAGHTLVLDMTGPTASGQDYDLYLHSSTGTQLAASEGSSTTERITWKNTGTTARTLYVRVSRYDSYSRVTPYTVKVAR